MLFFVTHRNELMLSEYTLDGVLRILREIYGVMTEDAVVWQGGRVVAVCQAGQGILHIAQPIPVSSSSNPSSN